MVLLMPHFLDIYQVQKQYLTDSAHLWGLRLSFVTGHPIDCLLGAYAPRDPITWGQSYPVQTPVVRTISLTN